jgi:hypothetical protein
MPPSAKRRHTPASLQTFQMALIHLGKPSKLVLNLWLTKYHIMMTYEGVELQLHAFLISALDGGELSASCSGRFILRERATGKFVLVLN